MTTTVHEYVTLDKLKPIGWFGTAFFLFSAVFAAHTGQWVPAIGLAVLALAPALLVRLAYGRFRVDETGIEVISARGRRSRLLWDEVRSVECGRQGNFVFHGEGKRLVLLPAGYWSGPYAARAHRRLVMEVDTRDLPIKETRLGDYKWNKNVAVNESRSGKAGGRPG
ncbi:MAG TPA: hypothetical protein VKA50_09015 [Gammaproteobacteria bacterium]|nr:hypothetical protein [Gammaproteobacteria bacterium]